MSRKSVVNALVGVGLVLVLGTGGVLLFLYTYERVEVEVESGYTGLARYNPYRAAELFLDDMGIPTESRFALGELPPSSRVLVVLAEDLQARRGMENRLREWVAGGGHLVLAASPPPDVGALGPGSEEPREEEAGAADALLAMAGLALARTGGAPPGVDADDGPGLGMPPFDMTPPGPTPPGTTPPGTTPPGTTPPGTAPPDGGPQDGGPGTGGGREPRSLTDLLRELGRRHDRRVVGVSLPVGSEPMQAEMEWRWTLVDALSEEQAAAYSTDPPPRPFVPVLEVPLENGWITVVVDPFFMTSRAIGRHDHARLLHELVVIGATPPSGAVLVVNAQSHGLAGLIWARGWAAVISVAILILAWVWMASRRFGPVLPEPDPARRSLMEHVEAVGEFLWRHGYHEQLLASTRAALRHMLAARLGGQALEGDALAQAVAAETGERESRVHQAFYGGGHRDRRAFTEAMRELQRLWRSK